MEGEGSGAAGRPWQAAKSTIKDGVAFLCCKQDLADVFFVVGKEGEKQRIPAHKFVLSVRSAVFYAMFNGGLARNGDPATARDAEEINLPDMDPPGLTSFLKFIYSDEVEILPDTVMATLYTAKKYDVPALVSACLDFLEKNLTAENAFVLLSQAKLFDEPRLAERCLEVIDKNASDAIAAEGFTDINLETLCSVLSRDTLRVKELTLFKAVCRWAEGECRRRGEEATGEKQREALGQAFFLLRFPLMTPEEFAEGPARSALLSDAECRAFLIHFHSHLKPPIPFPLLARSPFIGPELSISRFQKCNNGKWCDSPRIDSIKFTVDKQIYLTGMGLYCRREKPFELKVEITVTAVRTGVVLTQMESVLASDGSQETCKVIFAEPVEILKGEEYIAS